MRYAILIDTTAFGVVVPDLPGCFSAGDTLADALAAAREAARIDVGKRPFRRRRQASKMPGAAQTRALAQVGIARRQRVLGSHLEAVAPVEL